jgi:hypothetical protein
MSFFFNKNSAIGKIKASKLAVRSTEASINTNQNPTIASSFNKHRIIRNKIKHKIVMEEFSEKTYCNKTSESYKTGFNATKILFVVSVLKPPMISVCIKTRVHMKSYTAFGRTG